MKVCSFLSRQSGIISASKSHLVVVRGQVPQLSPITESYKTLVRVQRTYKLRNLICSLSTAVGANLYENYQKKKKQYKIVSNKPPCSAARLLAPLQMVFETLLKTLRTWNSGFQHRDRNWDHSLPSSLIS